MVVPPSAHEEVVDLAVEHGLDILSEKPIAHSMEASVRIADKVRRDGRKMSVTMSHRFDQDKSTLQEKLRSGRNGRIDYIVLRPTCNCRTFGSSGMFRHEIADPLLMEAAVHHLDILADLVGDECEQVYAEAWNPPWAPVRRAVPGQVTMRFRRLARRRPAHGHQRRGQPPLGGAEPRRHRERRHGAGRSGWRTSSSGPQNAARLRDDIRRASTRHTAGRW